MAKALTTIASCSESGRPCLSLRKDTTAIIIFIFTISSVALNSSYLNVKIPEVLRMKQSINEKYPNSSNNVQPINVTPVKSPNMLDFYIMGYPKCATSSMMRFFGDIVNQTDIIEMDGGTPEYHLATTELAERLLEKIEEGRNKSPEVKKYGIKDPSAIHRGFNLYWKNLIESNPQHEETKLLIGMRHPVHQFNSFYNFRQHVHGGMRPASTLVGSSQVGQRGVYTELAQYEKGLMQLGKFDLDHDDLTWLARNNKTVMLTRNKVFLYFQEQFSDTNMTRFQKFIEDVLAFVGVEEANVTTSDFPRVNTAGPKKEFDICNAVNKGVRKPLVKGGKATAKWFERKFENSKDVYVSDKEYFMSVVKSWGHDPCVETN